MTMSKELPEDVIIDILSRVPVRVILRFKSVSKSWYDLFQNPKFGIKHFHNQATNSDLSSLDVSFLFTPYQFTSTGRANRNIGLIPIEVPSDSKKSIRIPIEIDIPFLSNSEPLRVCGSCNGLICLSVMQCGSIILLWNPVTRVLKDLPLSPIDRPRTTPVDVVLGFGFDEVTNDYKVMRYYGQPVSQVEIYSLRTNSWREIRTRVQLVIFESACSVFLKGKFYWYGKGFMQSHGRKMIVCFDICSESFHYIIPPEFDFGGYDDGEDWSMSNFSWTVVVLKESVAVMGSSWNGSGLSFEVWLMKGYSLFSSWSKYRSFELQTNVGRPLGCGLKGEFLLEKDNNQVVLYDPDSRSIKNLGRHGVACGSLIFNHVGSLYPIKGGKVAQRTNSSAIIPDIFVPTLINKAPDSSSETVKIPKSTLLKFWVKSRRRFMCSCISDQKQKEEDGCSSSNV